MTQIRDRLHKAIAEQRRPGRERPPVVGSAQIEAAFRPVAEAAEELRRELSDVPGLAIVVAAHEVRIELHDKDLWLSYSPEEGKFVGSELTSLWMEGGQREEHLTWETAEACVEAMIQACARYASLAEIMARYPSR
ncbi:MAG: hypothetical protein HKM95_02155 [Inquilinus sp.]|nr:hypothetical protein [Inquilinus sp.]